MLAALELVIVQLEPDNTPPDTQEREAIVGAYELEGILHALPDKTPPDGHEYTIEVEVTLQ
jgi:hypothetical protein